jgi:hypothetical protein
MIENRLIPRMSFHVAYHFNLYNNKYIFVHNIMQVKIQIKMWIAMKQESQKRNISHPKE